MNTQSGVKKVKEVKKVYAPQKASDGAGVQLLRSIGSRELNHLDPFLLFDEFKSDSPDDYIGGFPLHPHRGFETVTYMLAGVMRHEDSTGMSGDLTAGAVQWMTAGRGIVHSEMPRQKDGLLWGFQLWVNLPAKDKMCEPRYQNIPPETMAEVECNGGVKVNVIAGTVNGVTGAVSGIAASPLYIDVTIPPNGEYSQPITEGHNTFAYIIGGEVSFGGDGETVSPSNLVTFGKGDGVYAHAGGTGGRFLLLSGQPLGEEIARHGPFVMNTDKEIEQAILDYRNGKF